MELYKNNARLESLLLFFIIVLPFNRVLAIDFGLLNLSLSEIVIIFGGVAVLMDESRAFILRRNYGKYLICMILFIIACILSLVNISDLFVGFRFIFSAMIKFLEFFFVAGVLIYSANKTKFLELYIYMMVLSAVVALFQISVGSGGDYEGNITGTFKFRNEFIFYVLPAALLSLMFFMIKKQTKFIIFYFLIALAILLSRGRTGLFVLIFCSLLMVLVWYRTDISKILVILMSIFLVGIAAFWLLPANITDELQYRYLEAYALEQEGDTGSSIVREVMFWNGIDKFKESPLIGHGAGDFLSISEEFVELRFFGIDKLQPHNSFLGLLVEVALIGVIPIFFLIFMILKTNKNADGFKNKTFNLYRILILGILINLAFFDGLFRELLWFILPFGLHYPPVHRVKNL